MRKAWMLLFVCGAACSEGERDKCERAAAKIAPLVEANQRGHGGDTYGGKVLVQKLADKCHARVKEHPDSEAELDCILGLSGELTLDRLDGCSAKKSAR